MCWIKIGKTDLIKEGKARAFQIEGNTLAVFRLANEFYALDSSCAHSGGPLDEGRIDPGTGEVHCPWHGWTFDVRTGQCTSSPGDGQKKYPLKVEGEDIFVGL